jgi:hypothetical protein
MLFPDAEANDIFNSELRKWALAAEEQGHRIAVWHGVDNFTAEDVEIAVNLDAKSGGLVLDGKLFPAKISEKGHLLVLHFSDPSKGYIEVNIDQEHLPMNLDRTGIEVFNDGNIGHLRLFDKLSGQDILKLDGDQLHELVDSKQIDHRNYHVSAFKYAEGAGLF